MYELKSLDLPQKSIDFDSVQGLGYIDGLRDGASLTAAQTMTYDPSTETTKANLSAGSKQCTKTIACSSQSAEQAELQECDGSNLYAVWLCSCDAQHG